MVSRRPPQDVDGAIIPVLLGSALAFSDGQFKTAPALLCALFACGMQIAANFINDLFDFQKGTDRRGRPAGAAARLRRRLDYAGSHENRHRHRTDTVVPGRAGSAVHRLGAAAPRRLGTGGAGRGVHTVCFPLYHAALLSGLGRRTGAGVLRLRAVCGTYYVQAYTLNMDVVVLSLVSGLAIDTLLMVNNYRDREQDAVSGKCTLVVRYGKKFGENMYLALGTAAVLLCFWFVYTGKLTPLEFIWAPCVYLYMHALTWRKMIQIGSGKKLNSILGETSRNMLFLGLLLAVALN